MFLAIQHIIRLTAHLYMCSILTKGTGCRKNKKLRFFLISIEQVMTNLLKKISFLAQIFTKLWPTYELHNYIILIIIINIIINIIKIII